MPQYPFVWSEYWKWRKTLPITAKEIIKRNSDYWNDDEVMGKNGFQPIMDNPVFIDLLKRVLG